MNLESQYVIPLKKVERNRKLIKKNVDQESDTNKNQIF